MPAKTKLAQLIARREGFGKPGDIPTVRHNPGDLRHSPHSTHPAGQPNAIGYIDNDEDGWTDLERQLALYAERGFNLRQMVAAYAPPNENATGEYLQFLCDGMGCQPEARVADLLATPATEQA